jgi:rhamnosyltransferase
LTVVTDSLRASDRELRVTAVVTWFRPNAEAIEGVRDALRQCDSVVVVDNTPAGEPALDAPPGVQLLRPGRNVGLAAALNLGLAQVPAAADAVLLLDQDSRLPADLVARLTAHLQQPAVGAAAPAPWDAAQGRYLDPRTGARPVVADLPVVITSGLLVRRKALADVGTLREDFFVDAVDLDLCLRLRRAGWRVRQDRNVRLPHRLGETQWHRVLGIAVRSSHHPTWRLYSGARNSAALTREHAGHEPRWAATNALLLAYWLLTVAAFEPPRAVRVRWFVRGLADGWRGRRPRIALPPARPLD